MAITGTTFIPGIVTTPTPTPLPGTTTVVFRPNSDGVPSEWDYYAFGNPPEKYKAVNQNVTYPTIPNYDWAIWTAATNKEQRFGFDSSALPAGKTVKKIELWWFPSYYEQPGSDNMSFDIFINGQSKGAHDFVGPEEAWLISGWYNLNLSKADINTLQLSIKSKTPFVEVDICALYLAVTYQN